MSTTHAVAWGAIDVITDELDEHLRRVRLVEPRARASVYTPSGQARFAELDERQLLKIIVDAASALDRMRVHREQVARDVRIPPPPRPTTLPNPVDR